MENTFNKLSLLSFFSGCFICRVRYCLYPIYIFALFAVFHYCSIESAFAIERDSGSKFQRSTFYNGNSRFDSLVYFGLPKSVDRNNSFKLRKNDSSEFVGSGIKPVSIMKMDSKIDGDKCNEKRDQVTSIFDKYFMHFIGFLSWFILWPFIFKSSK